MKTYYILIHWDKSRAVNGFLIPNAKDEDHALKMLKKALIIKRITASKDYGELSKDRITLFLKSLKRPWRLNSKDIRRNTNFNKQYQVRPTVQISELMLPTLAGYWLTDILTGQYICNQL